MKSSLLPVLMYYSTSFVLFANGQDVPVPCPTRPRPVFDPLPPECLGSDAPSKVPSLASDEPSFVPSLKMGTATPTITASPTGECDDGIRPVFNPRPTNCDDDVIIPSPSFAPATFPKSLPSNTMIPTITASPTGECDGGIRPVFNPRPSNCRSSIRAPTLSPNPTTTTTSSSPTKAPIQIPPPSVFIPLPPGYVAPKPVFDMFDFFRTTTTVDESSFGNTRSGGSRSDNDDGKDGSTDDMDRNNNVRVRN